MVMPVMQEPLSCDKPRFKFNILSGWGRLADLPLGDQSYVFATSTEAAHEKRTKDTDNFVT
jgi:hypothetical protein